MITLTHSVITGIVQGLSEFLPISSSAHIVFATSIYKIITGVDFSVINAEETFGARLLSIHNIRYLIRLTESIREAIKNDSILELREEFIKNYYGDNHE